MNYEAACESVVAMCSDLDAFKRLFNSGLNERLFIESVSGLSTPRKVYQYAKTWYLRDGTVPSRNVLEQEYEQYFSNHEIKTPEYQPELVVKYLKDNAVRAKVQDEVKEAVSRIFEDDADEVQELGRFHRNLSRLYLDVSSTGDVQDISMAAPEVVQSLLSRADDADLYRRSLVKFPFDIMNQYYFGVRPRELMLFFGYTGDMKSLTLELTTLENAKAGKRVAHFTLENGIEATLTRMIAMQTGLPLSRLQSGGIMPKERPIVEEAREYLKTLPILFDQSAGVEERSVEAIFTKARSFNADVVVLDQATWITSPDAGYKSTWENIAAITRRIKQHTNELGVATFLASQANRESQKTKQGTGLAHVAGSDELTKTATLAATLDFDKVSELLKVIIVKNRNGSASLEFTMSVELETRTRIDLNQVVSA